MASNAIIFLVIVNLFCQSLQDINNNEIEIEIDEKNPYREAEQELKIKQQKQIVGTLINNILENGGNDLFSGLISHFNTGSGSDMAQGLANMFANQIPKLLEKESPDAIGTVLNMMTSFVGKDGQENKKNSLSDIMETMWGSSKLTGTLSNVLNIVDEIRNKRTVTDDDDIGKLGQLILRMTKYSTQQGTISAMLNNVGNLLNELSEGKKKGVDLTSEITAGFMTGLGTFLSNNPDLLKKGHYKLGEVPDLAGSMINLLRQNENNKASKNPKETQENKINDPKASPDFNMGDMMMMANTLMGQFGQKGDGEQGNVLTLLSTVLETVNSFTGPDAENRAKSHDGHSSLMPPMLEKFHIFFDHFIHSKMGEDFIAVLGAEKSFKMFLDDKGRFSYKKFGDLMENLSFRKQWISIVTDRLAKFIKFSSKPHVYKGYLTWAQIFFNTYLNTQNFPKSALFDPAKPVESISSFVNYIAKRQFGLQIDTKDYVKPAVDYIKDLVEMAEKSGGLKSLSNSDLSNKIADTINLEIIEPLVRVNRAYRFAKATPKCDRYVLCLVNEESQNDKENLPDLKKLLYKGSSLLAGWYLSAQTGTSFWTLYTDITNNTNCKELSTECDGFHVEDLKATTEYIHNEL